MVCGTFLYVWYMIICSMYGICNVYMMYVIHVHMVYCVCVMYS